MLRNSWINCVVPIKPGYEWFNEINGFNLGVECNLLIYQLLLSSLLLYGY